MTEFLVGLVSGGAAMAVYNHYFSSRVEKIGQDIIDEFNKIKAKI